MTLDQIERLAKNLISKHLDSSIWKFEWNRQNTTFGICNYTKSVISLSKHLVPGEPNKIIKDIILHEISHAIVGYGNGHNEIWRQTAIKIGLKDPQKTIIRNKNNPGGDPKWIVTYKNEIVQRYYKKPGFRIFNNINKMWIPGREEETEGHLKLIKYSEYTK